jgi:hypothetical protein
MCQVCIAEYASMRADGGVHDSVFILVSRVLLCRRGCRRGYAEAMQESTLC